MSNLQIAQRIFSKVQVVKEGASPIKDAQVELNVLLSQAHREYLHDVIVSKKLYHRYVRDYLSSIVYIDATDASSLNAHNRNINILKELLEEREDLVKEYFSKTYVGYYEELLHKFNTTHYTHYSNNSTKLKRSFHCSFNEAQFEILRKYMQRLNLFHRALSLDGVKALFSCKRLPNLPKSTNNRTLARFFATLSLAHLITSKWAATIGKNQLIEKSKSNTTLTHTDLSSALTASQAKDYETNNRDQLALIAEMKELLLMAADMD
jgi:hypothetical protein